MIEPDKSAVPIEDVANVDIVTTARLDVAQVRRRKSFRIVKFFVCGSFSCKVNLKNFYVEV